jgi:hypothetical protein
VKAVFGEQLDQTERALEVAKREELMASPREAAGWRRAGDAAIMIPVKE